LIKALAFNPGIKKAGKLAGPVHDGFHAMLKMFDPTNGFLEEHDAFATRASYEREKECLLTQIFQGRSTPSIRSRVPLNNADMSLRDLKRAATRRASQ